MPNFGSIYSKTYPKKKKTIKGILHKNQILMTISLQLSTHRAHKIRALLQDMESLLVRAELLW